MKVQSEIWKVNLNQSEPIWTNLKSEVFAIFQTTGLKWIWKQSEANPKSEKSIWKWAQGKSNIRQSETEFKGKFNRTQTETEFEEKPWTRSRRTWLSDTIGNWHPLIPPKPLQPHTRVWKACHQGGRSRRSRYHGMEINHPGNFYLSKSQKVV